MRVSHVAVLVSVLIIFGLGCTTHGHPITNVSNAPVPVRLDGKPTSIEEVQKAILRAGLQSGWIIQPESPGRMTSRATFGTGDRHVAIVDIEYNVKQYSINYRDSTNLAADPAQNTIHRAYNEWVARLDKAIRTNLVQ